MINVTGYGFEVAARSPSVEPKKLDADAFRSEVIEAASKFFGAPAYENGGLDYRLIMFIKDTNIKLVIDTYDSDRKPVRSIDVDSVSVRTKLSFGNSSHGTSPDHTSGSVPLVAGHIGPEIINSLTDLCEDIQQYDGFKTLANTYNAIVGPHGKA